MNLKNIRLKPMIDAHLTRVLEIEGDVFTTPWTSEMFTQEVEGHLGSRPIVATLLGKVVGYAIAWFFDEDVHLVNIAVAGRLQSKGIGKLLVNDVIRESRKRDKEVITLEVRAGHAGVQAFYRRFGFRGIGLRKGYYSDNREDALLMILELDRQAPAPRAGEGESSVR